jgi:hypothetical protein
MRNLSSQQISASQRVLCSMESVNISLKTSLKNLSYSLENTVLYRVLIYPVGAQELSIHELKIYITVLYYGVFEDEL